MMCEEEDPSTMTIEFLRARLQLQRAEYRAEKRRAQVLAQKVVVQSQSHYSSHDSSVCACTHY